MKQSEPHIVVKDLAVAHGSNVIQHDLTFIVNRGDIFKVISFLTRGEGRAEKTER